MASFAFSKKLRLLKSSEFDRVMRAKTSAVNGRLRLYCVANELGHPRLGLTVSRRVGKAAVRNRWKRALRDAFRLVQHELPAYDLVCIPHRNVEPNVAQLQASLAKLARQVEERRHRHKQR